MTRDELKSHIDTIEECYEFFLAYASLGTTNDADTKSGTQLRDFLQRTEVSLATLAAGLTSIVERERLEPLDAYHDMIEVLGRDAAKARAAVRLVRAQPSISSQLVDNLNATIHVRALLTDVFLLDELLKGQSAGAAVAASNAPSDGGVSPS